MYSLTPTGAQVVTTLNPAHSWLHLKHCYSDVVTAVNTISQYVRGAVVHRGHTEAGFYRHSNSLHIVLLLYIQLFV